MAGFTVTELVMVMTIIGILAAIGLPSFKYVTTSNRISSEINGSSGDMQFARSQAIKQGLTVTVCSSSDGATCNTGGAGNIWNTGWIVFLDSNGNQQVDPGEQVIRVQPAFNSTDTMTLERVVRGDDLQSFGLRAHLHGRHDQHHPARHHQHVGLDALSRDHGVRLGEHREGWSGEPQYAIEQPRTSTQPRRLSLGPRYRRARGFSLMEVMVALVVSTVGLLGLAKMEALAISSTGVAELTLACGHRGLEPRRRDACESRVLAGRRCTGEHPHQQHEQSRMPQHAVHDSRVHASCTPRTWRPTI